MNNLHQKLTQKYQSYNNWHQTKHHNKIHWGVLVVFTLLIFGTILRWTPISLAADTTAPTVPTNLTVIAISSSQINLSWIASTDDVGVAGYKIYRCTGSACAPTVQIATSAVNSYSNTGLTASTVYTYIVSAYDTAGNESGKSALASATTLAFTGNTYYISPTGSDTNGDGSSNKPWATLSKSFSTMIGGDTLILKNGIYTGDLNRITTSNYPPYGSSIQYTTIKAENDGSVIIDGQDSTFMFYFHPSNVTNAYWKFEGIIWARSSGNGVYLGNTAYVKFLRCGVFDAGSGNNGGFVIGRGATYILLEDCYAWGSGRYKFLLYHGNRIILRRCVARFDKADAGGNVIAAFSIYASDRVEVQNGISIDGDNPGFWLNVGEYGGSFLIPSTDGPSTNINIVGSIALNVAMQFGNLTKNLDNITIKNSVGYHLREGVWARDSANYNHVTIGDLYGPSLQVPNVGLQYYPGDDPINSINIRNSILYKIKGTALTSFDFEDYNVLYGNNLNYDNTSAGKNTITNSNPNLKYLTRIESDNSLLHNKASDGGDIGANILYRYGVSGTLWGEPGYDQLTNEQLWPFPNEDIIKTHMASYEGPPSGKRGFAVDGNGLYGGPITLTSYIWEYLGNPCPAGICVAIPVTTPPTIPTNLTATPISSSQINLSWTASTDDTGVTGYKIYRCQGTACAPTVQIATSAVNSYSNTGLTASTAYTYAVSAYDAAGNESGKSSSVTATTLSQFKPSDLNQDGLVNQLDFDILKQDWARTDKPASDLNQDGIVDTRDLGIMMSEWTR